MGGELKCKNLHSQAPATPVARRSCAKSLYRSAPRPVPLQRAGAHTIIPPLSKNYNDFTTQRSKSTDTHTFSCAYGKLYGGTILVNLICTKLTTPRQGNISLFGVFLILICEDYLTAPNTFSLRLGPAKSGLLRCLCTRPKYAAHHKPRGCKLIG